MWWANDVTTDGQSFRNLAIITLTTSNLQRDRKKLVPYCWIFYVITMDYHYYYGLDEILSQKPIPAFYSPYTIDRPLIIWN